MRRHDKRVGNSHDFVFRRTYTGYEWSFLDHVTRRIVQLDTVAQFKRTHVGDDQTGNNIPDNGARPQRNNQTHKYRYPLKYSRIGSRQIRINHRNHKGIEQKTDNVIGRHGPVGIESVQFKALFLHLIRQITKHPHQILDSNTDDKNGEQIGDIGQHTIKDAFHRIPNIGKQLIGQIFGLRKDGEQQRHCKQQLQQHNDIPEQIGQPYQYNHLPACVQQLKVLNGKCLQARMLQPDNACLQLAEQPVGKFEQQELSYNHQQEISNTFAQLPKAMLGFHHLQLFYNHLTPDLGQTVARTTFPQTVLVGKRNKYLVAIHQVGNNIGTFDVDRIRMQIEALAQRRDVA